MLLSKGKGSLETANTGNKDFNRSSPGGHRRRLHPVAENPSPSSSTLLPTTFSTPGKSNRFSTQQMGNNPCSNFFLGGAFYPGKDKKIRQLKRKTLWYRLFCSSPWRRVLSLLATTYLLFSTVIRPLSSFVLDYGSFLASSRRRKGLHGTWLLYDESLLTSIRTVEEERAEAMRLSDEQQRLLSGADKRHKTLERIVPGWYHRNDVNADKNKVVEEKLKEVERLIEQREESSLKKKHAEKKDEGRHIGSSKDGKDPKGKVEQDSTEKDPVDKRRLANASSNPTLRNIHNMDAYRNNSSCPSTLPASDIRITLVVQSTPDRLWILTRTCQRWTDPIVLVVFFNSEEAMVAEAVAEETGDCPQMQVIKYLMYSSMKEDGKAKYPVNRLRNIGLDAVQTSHVLMIDVDFVPSHGLAALIRPILIERNNVRSRPLNTSTSLPPEDEDAIVVPAFERIPPSELCSGPDCVVETKEELQALTLPESFDELRACVSEHKECRVFQSNNNWDGHSSTRSKDWLAAKWYDNGDNSTISENARSIRKLQCFDSVRYEPYVVLRWCPASTEGGSPGPVAPFYDERFHGYGKNKIELISHLRIIGYTFSILPEGFIIHAPHSISNAKKAWESPKESSLHQNMDQLYPKFLKELVAKYHDGKKRKIIKQC